MYSGLRSIRDAVVVSSDSLLFIVFRHAAFVIRSVCSLPRISLLHFMIQARYTVSGTGVFISGVAPAYGRAAHRVCDGVVFESDTNVSGAKVNMLSSAVMTMVVVLT